ncbi:MAG TPA: pyrroline-5-carboxylate reductase [Thermoplasmata archaeon]|nr:pyrroline-5-carboxylate reductase [Thermoplasmata archaeon]
MDKKRIAVIGVGNMGGALLKGMMRRSWARPENFIVSDSDRSKLELFSKELKVKTTDDNRKAAKGADIILLAVKPQILDQVLEEIREGLSPKQILVSVAAGVKTEHISSRVKKEIPVIRAMPNISALVGESATAISRGKHASKDDMKLAREILESVGTVVEVQEYLMDAVTGLSGTGPMYVFLIVEGLSDAGVKVGLSRDIANALSVQTLLGAAKMIKETNMHPAKLKDLVTSPGGTAIAALHSLEKSGLKAMLIDAVETATNRSQELGKHPHSADENE